MKLRGEAADSAIQEFRCRDMHGTLFLAAHSKTARRLWVKLQTRALRHLNGAVLQPKFSLASVCYGATLSQKVS